MLKASPAIDHWQEDREQIEAEELLGFVLGEEPDDDDDVPGVGAAVVRWR